MPINTQDQEIDPTLHLPRILCLHGGGVNADIFRLQARTIIKQLKPYFRLVFADGPFICNPHSAIIPIYKDYGPFRRWLRWLPEHAPINADTAIDEVDYYIRSAIDEDNRNGGTGSWVGLMGFSQGAKMAGSILYRQQVREEKLGKAKAGSEYRFAVLLAGRAPLVSLDQDVITSEALAGAEAISIEFTDWPDEWSFTVQNQDHVLRLPTVHVHGLEDPGLELHRKLLDQYCEPGTTRCVVWGGDHRVPFKQPDVEPLVKNILEVARETGVLKR